MARDIKKSVSFYPGVDTEFDKLGDAASFTMVIKSMVDGSDVVNDGAGTFEELINTASGHTGDTAGAAVIGDSTITLAAGSTLTVGEAFDDGAGNLYYISSVAGDVIGLKKPLVADIADATTLNAVGNTGLYKAEAQIAAEGEYMVTVAHPEFGHIALKYNVVTNTLDDAVTNANSRFDELDSKLQSMGATGSMQAIA